VVAGVWEGAAAVQGPAAGKGRRWCWRDGCGARRRWDAALVGRGGGRAWRRWGAAEERARRRTERGDGGVREERVSESERVRRG
jgi:hypothetical protein